MPGCQKLRFHVGLAYPGGNLDLSFSYRSVTSQSLAVKAHSIIHTESVASWLCFTMACQGGREKGGVEVPKNFRKLESGGLSHLPLDKPNKSEFGGFFFPVILPREVFPKKTRGDLK